MRVRLEHPDRAPYWLIGDPALNPRDGDSSIEEFDLQISRNMQSVSGAEWDAQASFDRANQKLVITASGYRTFESEEARMDFIALLAPADSAALLHEWEGDVWIRQDVPGTTEFREWPLYDAVVSLVGTRLTGEVGLHLNYRVTAPGIGSKRSGQSELVQLIGAQTPDFLLTAMAAEMQTLVDAATTADTIDFPIELSRELIGGSYVGVQRWLLPVGSTPVPGISYELPVASALPDLASSINIISGLSVTGTAEKIEVRDAAPVTSAYINLELRHRYNLSYGGTATAILATWTAALDDNGAMILTGTKDGVTYKLTGISQTIFG